MISTIKGTTIFTLLERTLTYDRFQSPTLTLTIKSVDTRTDVTLIHTVTALSFKEAIAILVPKNKIKNI